MIELNLMSDEEYRAALQKLLEDGIVTKKRFDALSENPQSAAVARISEIKALKGEYTRLVARKPLTFAGMIHTWIECKLIRRQVKKLEKKL